MIPGPTRRADGWYVRLPVGAVVVFPDGTRCRVAEGGDLEPVVQGHHPHGLMATAPIATLATRGAP